LAQFVDETVMVGWLQRRIAHTVVPTTAALLFTVCYLEYQAGMTGLRAIAATQDMFF
jgi:hypothetical protein